MIKLKEILDNILLEAKRGKKNKGLWYNIHQKRKRGEAPAKKGSKAFKQAFKAGKKINKNK